MADQSHSAKIPHFLTRLYRNVLWEASARLFTTLTVDTHQGKLTVFTSDQFIGRAFYVRRPFDLAWINAALNFLRESNRLPEKGKGTFLDVGANIGVISIGILHHTEFERAIGIEPEPRNFGLLQHNARQNQLSSDRYVCLPYAASDRDGEAEFELSNKNFGDHRVRNDLDRVPEGQRNADRFHESSRQTIRVRLDLLDKLLTVCRPKCRTTSPWAGSIHKVTKAMSSQAVKPFLRGVFLWFVKSDHAPSNGRG